MHLTSDMIAYVAFGLIAVAIAVIVHALADHEPTVVPRLGLRGLRRHEARMRSGGFRLFEPAIRLVGGWVEVLPLGSFRASCDRRLWYAGDHLGLTADEWVGMCLLVGAGGGGVALGAVGAAGLPIAFVPAVGVVGVYVAFSNMDAVIAARRSAVERDLPSAIDLIALCMSAGLTFPNAIKDVAERWPKPNDAIVQELRQVLHRLKLGHTRAHALKRLADRVPCDSVSDFVAAVIQSEAKGTPLREVLQVQGKVMRSRRSMLAEEAAAKAAVKLVFPLMLLLLSLFIIIVGPLALRTQDWGM